MKIESGSVGLAITAVSGAEPERRFVAFQGAEVRASGRNGIRGRAAVFGSVADLGSFTEELAPGAFDDALLSSDPVAVFNHDASLLLGRVSAGTLRLRATPEALEFEIPDLPRSRGDVLEAVTRRDVTGSSFSFSLPADGSGERWTKRNGRDHRIIERIAVLWDVSPVTTPAYSSTTVSTRTLRRTGGKCPGPGCDPSYRSCGAGRFTSDEQRRVAAARLAAEASPPAPSGTRWTSRGKTLAAIRAEVRRIDAAGRQTQREPVVVTRLKPSRWGAPGRATAIEEAAHAIIAYHFGFRMVEVAVLGPGRGYARYAEPPEGPESSHPMAVIRLAGPIARALFEGCRVDDVLRHGQGSDGDLRAARTLTGTLDRDRWREAVRESEELVRRFWYSIEFAADRLVSTPGGRIRGRALEQLLDEALTDT